MALKFRATESKAVVRPGLYPATLANVEEREGVNGPFLMWFFNVAVDGIDAPLGTPTSVKFTSGAKARKYAELLLGRPLEDDEEIELESLYGASCQVLVTVAKLDGGGTVNRIEKVLAAAPESADGDGSL